MRSEEERQILWLCTLMGVGLYFFIYGYGILDPTNVAWTMSGDAAQHFLGWQFFRNEPWTLPLGTIRTFAYPEGTSLVYTDSIPLFALPLKLFESWLPDIVQYHGWWLLLCYALQGYFSGLLLSLWTNKKLLIILGSVFFLLSPVMVQRAGGHEALSAHWLLLAALYLYWRNTSFPQFWQWLILLCVAILVHFYLAVMVWGVFIVYWLKCWNHKLAVKYYMLLPIVILMATVTIMWLVGYFVIPVSNSSAGGFGYYSMNILSPFYAGDMSTFLRPFLLAGEGQYEGFNYFGLGLIGLLTIIIVLVWQKSIFLLINPKKHILLLGLMVVFTMLAISNKVTVGNWVLLEFELPAFMEKLLGVLRSSGRMFWPVTYVMIVAAFVIVVRFLPYRKALLLLSISAGVQAADLLPGFWGINYHSDNAADKLLQAQLWGSIVPMVDTVAFVPPVANYRERDDYVPLALLASQYGKNFNVAYLARGNNAKREQYQHEFMQSFKAGHLDRNTLYIINGGDFYAPTGQAQDFRWGVLEGYPIILSTLAMPEKSALTPWDFSLVVSTEKIMLETLLKQYAKPGYTVILAVCDDAQSNLHYDNALTDLANLGSRINELQYRGSYASIVVDGVLSHEQLNNADSVAIRTDVKGHAVDVFSGGQPFGNRANISIDGRQYALDRRGLNAVVFSTQEKTIRRYVFDTHQAGNFLAGSE